MPRDTRHPIEHMFDMRDTARQGGRRGHRRVGSAIPGLFDKLATDRPVGELLAAARPARRAPRSPAAPAAREDRVNYATLEHAGTPHKGKTTDAEKQLVQEHLDQINERLATENQRPIGLTDPDHVERYGLERLAEERASNAA